MRKLSACLLLALITLVSSATPIMHGPRLFVSGGGGGTGPTYTPFYTWSAAGGTLGNQITGWQEFNGGGVTYGNAVAGPFGGSRVGNVVLTAGTNAFGGIIVDVSSLSIGNGDDIWMRIYHYFPSGFCFSSGNVSESPWGGTKWYRWSYGSGDTQRFTAQMGGLSGGNEFVSGPTCQTSVGWGGFTDEYGGGGGNRHIPAPAVAQITRGSWIAIQIHVALRTNSTGYMESWLNDTYLGRAEMEVGGATSYITMPPGGSPIDFFVFGDYWNGAPYFGDDFYIDEIIITTETPNTLDSGGRPFIDPDTQVSDF